MRQLKQVKTYIRLVYKIKFTIHPYTTFKQL